MNDLFRQAASCIRQNHRLLENWTSNFTARKALVLESIEMNKSNNATSTIFDLSIFSSSKNTAAGPSTPSFHVATLHQMANQIFDTLLISTNEPGSAGTQLGAPNLPHHIQNVINFRRSFLNYFPSTTATTTSPSDCHHHSLFASSSSSSSLLFSKEIEIPFGITPQFRSPRKERQIRRIAGMLRHLKRSSGVETVVDVGGGTGVLGELLACDFGISTCVLERDQRLIEKGRHFQSSRATKRLLRRLESRIDVSKEIFSVASKSSNSTSLSSSSSSSASHLLGNTIDRICSSCLLTGVHACGSLSDAVFLNALRHNKIRSFMIVPCCHQKKIICSASSSSCTNQQQAILFSDLAQEEKVDDSSSSSVNLGQFLNNVEYLKLANFSHELSREEFVAFSRKFLYQHCLVELFHKDRGLFEKMILAFANSIDGKNESAALVLESVSSVSKISRIVSKMSGQARDSNTCGFSVGTKNHRLLASKKGEKHSNKKRHFRTSCHNRNEANHHQTGKSSPFVSASPDDDHFLESPQIVQASCEVFSNCVNNNNNDDSRNFSSFCEVFVKTVVNDSIEKSCDLNFRFGNQSSSSSSSFSWQILPKEVKSDLDKYCDSLFSSSSSSSPTAIFHELYFFLFNKCLVDMLGSAIEATIFLDRVMTIQEDEKKSFVECYYFDASNRGDSQSSRKWENVFCGSLFSSGTSPRRFGLWGMKKDPVLLLN